MLFSVELLLRKGLAMTMTTSPAEPKGLEKSQMGIEDIVESLRSVGDDVAQIVKLTSEEKVLVSDFLPVLKQVPQRMFSVPISTSGLPARIRAFTQARLSSDSEQKLVNWKASWCQCLILLIRILG